MSDQSPTTPTAPLQVAMLSFAHEHAVGYAGCLNADPLAELAVIADPDAERGQAAAERFATTWVADYREVLARDDIDAVIICSENSLHHELTLAAAAAGKHVLCEKPLATSVADAREMVDACARAGVKLQTAFPVRFNTPTVALREAIRNEQVGKVLAIAARNPGMCPGGWFVDPELSGGGAVIDHTVHVVDALRWIFDAEFTEVYAEVDSRIHGIPTDDTGLLMLRMDNGIRVSLDTTWSRPSNWPTWGGVTMEVIGERGVLSLDAFNNAFTLVENQTPSNRRVPIEVTGDPELVHAFLTSVLNDTPPEADGLAGLRAVEVALGAYESARTGAPVAITHE